jgi:hypothetical protein
VRLAPVDCRDLGALVALLAIVGYTVFGWRFGETGGSIPFVLGAAVAILAVGWTLYQRLSSS